MRPNAARRLSLDLAIIIAGVAAALLLLRAGVFNQTLAAAGQWGLAGCFVAGLFFTSVLTVGPASVALALLGEMLPPFQVALWGAVGALVGDLFIFYILRNRIASGIDQLVEDAASRRVQSFFRLGFVRVIAPVVGGLIIASPLPDELGLALMGLSRTRAWIVAPISFAMNFLGILALVAAVRVW